MERLAKIAIYIAIAVGLTFFSLFLITILPHILSNVGHEWERLLDENSFAKSTEDLKQMFREHPAYVAFMKKYPDGGEYFRDRGQGNGGWS